MIVTDILLWWYGSAWTGEIGKISSRTTRVLSAFSVVLLLKTLFAPFRQIDAGSVHGSMQAQFRAWSDRTFSRAVGFVVRSFVIVTGCLVALLVGLISAVYALLWLFVPLLPILGIILWLSGWTIL